MEDNVLTFTRDIDLLAEEARNAARAGAHLECEVLTEYFWKWDGYRRIVRLDTEGEVTDERMYGWEANGDGHFLSGWYRIVGG